MFKVAIALYCIALAYFLMEAYGYAERLRIHIKLLVNRRLMIKVIRECLRKTDCFANIDKTKLLRVVPNESTWLAEKNN